MFDSHQHGHKWTQCIVFALACISMSAVAVQAAPPLPAAQALPGTQPLTETRPLDEVMVAGIDRHALAAIESARQQRSQHWHHDFQNPDAYQRSVQPNRERFAAIIGVVDPRLPARGIELLASTTQPALVVQSGQLTADAVRWPVIDGIDAEGLWIQPTSTPVARVIAIPDADWTPEMILGGNESPTQFAAHLAAIGCEVLVPTLINRDHNFSRNDAIGRSVKVPHREFIYRQAFELGRHVVGYEVQKVLAAVDQLELRNQTSGDLPIVVIGVGEGGRLALYSAALDPRIDSAIVSGYFDRREQVWAEPIDRNVWDLLTQFGDAELACMIAPRSLYLETSPQIAEFDGSPTENRPQAAPGVIKRPEPSSVSQEVQRAAVFWDKLNAADRLRHDLDQPAGGAPLSGPTVAAQISTLVGRELPSQALSPLEWQPRPEFSAEERQQRQIAQMVQFTQSLLRKSFRQRDALFTPLDRSSAAAFDQSAQPLRDLIHRELIGKLPDPAIAANPRSRKILEEADYVGYEIVLDVYPEVIAAGVLLLPKDLRPGERRPVVVCQHGLEGTPIDTIAGPESDGYRAYKGFSAALAHRGFIVYAPQNPYRGEDAFRTLQRKSNPLGRSLFSYIIGQHQATLRWLASLPQVDPKRIAFYGLSYGGKTAMRVPPLLPPSDSEPGYCLSICSGDFNEWVAKNASTDAPFSYVWTGEYEIFEWNMGHLANYAELAMLMTPRPFMVERGHDDGVAIDEWVAWEFAKVRRHYNKLGIGERAEIEYFDGPHTIHGQGTYEFLHRHLDWPRETNDQ